MAQDSSPRPRWAAWSAAATAILFFTSSTAALPLEPGDPYTIAGALTPGEPVRKSAEEANRIIMANANAAYSQNDANTGADAPNAADAALPLTLGTTYAGTLLTVPGGELGVPALGDPADWYSFNVAGPAQLTAWITVQSDSAVGNPQADQLLWTYLEVYAPSGSLAAYTWSSSPGHTNTRIFHVEESGTYKVRLWPQYAGPPLGGSTNLNVGLPGTGFGGVQVEIEKRQYAFRLSSAAPTTPFASQDDNGYVALPFTVGPGGSAAPHALISFLHSHEISPQAYVMLLRRNPDGAWAIRDWNQAGFATEFQAPNAQVLGTATPGISTSPQTRPYYAVRALPAVNEPGDYMVVAMGRAINGYLTVEVRPTGDVTIGEASRAGSDGMLMLLPHEFEGIFGASGTTGVLPTLGFRVSFGTFAHINNDGLLLAVFDCTMVGRCRVINPSGEVRNVQDTRLFLSEGAAGDWTFHRDLEAAAARNVPVLFAASIPLP